jgi:putative membrane-bound dehydrogenase-like protein
MMCSCLIAVVLGVGPFSPAESCARIILPEGYVAEVVAAEPLVVDPVAISFNEHGEMFVAEYRDYPLGPADPTLPALSRIKRLRDLDHDGIMDEASVFAEGLPWCQGVFAWEKGVLATIAHELVYLEDSDGDGMAEKRETVLQGLGRANPQLEPAFPVLGRDGWIYLTNGLSGGKVKATRHPELEVELGSSDARWHPVSGALEAIHGPGQFGQTFDDWGNRFTCSNRRPIIHDVLPRGSGPYANVLKGTGSHDVAMAEGASRVYPAIDTNTTAFSHTGTHTAACGVLVYRGTGLGASCDGWVFVCDPTGYLVTAQRLTPDGLTFRAERVLNESDRKLDWLTSSDAWFRPVSLANGPDGSLYVVDMYRQVIEHPAYMPAGMAEGLNLRAGDDRGRIYRVRRKGVERPGWSGVPDRSAWVEMLSDAEGWRRDLAFRLLRPIVLSGKDAELVDRLRRETVSGATREGRMAAMQLLSLGGALDDATLGSGLNDEEVLVREGAWREVVDRVTTNKEFWSDRIYEGMTERSARIRSSVTRAACRMGEQFGRLFAIGAIVDDRVDRFLWESVREEIAALGFDWNSVMFEEDEVLEPSEEVRRRYRDLGVLIAARSEPDVVGRMLGAVVSKKNKLATRMATLAGVAEGMPMSRHAAVKPGLTGWMQHPPPAYSSVVASLASWRELALLLSRDRDKETSVRCQSLELLPAMAGEEAREVLVEVATSGAADEVCLTAVRVISRMGGDFPVERLLAVWSTMTAGCQQALLEACWERTGSTLALLDVMSNGSLSKSVVSVDRRELLLVHPDSAIRGKAKELFGSSATPDRLAVLEQYRSALHDDGDIGRGEAVFRRVCVTCHRLGTLGTAVGPDISDVRNKVPEQLLSEIVDPNRVVEPRYVATTIVTDDGRTLSGVVLSQTSDQVVLVKPGGLEERLSRGTIEEMRTSNLSLMPQGIEREISPAEMNDLIAFLRSQR